MIETQPTQVAAGVHRLGSELVNFYLLEDRGRLTLVDSGLPTFLPQVEQAVAQLGKQLTDIEAIVLTHGHGDHIGLAERIRRDASATVYLHQGDEQMVREGQDQKRERGMLGYLRNPAAWRLLIHFARNGGLKPARVEILATFANDAQLDVPGRPFAVHTPGHSHGHCVLYLEDKQALIAGDALCSLNPLTGRRGPQILPSALNASTDQALDSLGRMEGLSAQTVMFGHGEPWTEGVAGAVKNARELGKS